MRERTENPAQNRELAKKQALKRYFAFLLALMMFLSSFAALAEEGAEVPSQGDPAEGLPEDFDFSDSTGIPVGEDGEFEASSGLEGVEGINLLTEQNFSVDDVPEEYLEEAPRASRGRVEKLRYVVSVSTDSGVDPSGGGTADSNKSCMVYLPAGYDESDRAYNVMFIVHASNGSPTNYLDPDKVTTLQCLLDNMIASGELEPLIVVAPTYYTSGSFTQFLPLIMQVDVVSDFPREVVEDILPVVIENYRTFAASSSTEDIVASRNHRAMAGFSLGGVATWYAFMQQMRAFKWFLPISEASWDDGDGGTSGIFDSDVSAQALYDAVVAQGYAKDDFRLYVATGTEDEAFEVSTNQMISLLEYADMFMPGENTSCSMMIGGTHTLKALYTYLYHILPTLFLGDME